MDFETEDLNNYIYGYDDYVEPKEEKNEEDGLYDPYDLYMDRLMEEEFERERSIRLSL